MLAEVKSLNRVELKRLYPTVITAANDAIDGLHSLASFHAWTLTSWIDATPHAANHVLFPCFHKTLLSLHAALELTLDGLFGLARPHLRQAFESLIIAKFCAMDPQTDIFDRWIDGLDFYFTNGILKKIEAPDISQFSETWNLLCKFSHATVYANQLSLDLETTKEETEFNLAFVGAMIHCTYHLLNSHILTPTVKYHAARYGRSSRGNDAKVALKISLDTLRSAFGSASARIVRDYRSAWRVK